MTMAEAGEVGHWQILDTMNQRARNQELQQVIDWATPIQERHLERGAAGLAQARRRRGPERARLGLSRSDDEARLSREGRALEVAEALDAR